MGTRNEFENNIPDSTWPAGFDKIEDNRLAKCLISLTMQTGPLAELYRAILSKRNITVYQFCSLGNTEVYSPHSEFIHQEELPDHCFTMDVYEDIIKSYPKLKDFFKKGERRYDLVEAVLEMRRARLQRNSQRGLGM